MIEATSTSLRRAGARVGSAVRVRRAVIAAAAVVAGAATVLAPTSASAVNVADRSEVISKENGGLFTFLNNGTNANGTINWGPKTQNGWGWNGADDSVYFADLDGNGWSEVISKENGGLFSFKNNGVNANGTVSWGPKTQNGWGWNGADDSVYFADLDGNGWSEVISKENGGLFSFKNNGVNANGTVNWGTKTQVGWGWNGANSSVYFADLNLDNRSEVISKENGGLFSFKNNGTNANGTVNWGTKTQIGWGWNGANSSVYFADLLP
ncbi:FG-GAP repeat domain-containing protein [Yinghuangia soli]|uniref:VCBS repeat-containing protein n=1 Tax=Yinghuangia soli TaxID=2908204 RepID=A0AA41QAW8_9ACTN|nr:VCBS repeat-containing protein [Yinghuangia soli]MCF2533946.1 VCBS repeat-containing protein [Yinghuangia soli]